MGDSKSGREVEEKIDTKNYDQMAKIQSYQNSWFSVKFLTKFENRIFSSEIESILIQKNRTRLAVVCIGAVQFFSGEYYDIQAIVKAAHEVEKNLKP